MSHRPKGRFWYRLHELFGVALTSIFRRLQRDRPWLGLGLGTALFVLGASGRYFLGEFSDGFEPIAFLPAILLGDFSAEFASALRFASSASW